MQTVITITVNNWWFIVPTVITIAAWIWAIFFHEKSNNRGFNLDGALESFTAVMATLTSWLIYFIIF